MQLAPRHQQLKRTVPRSCLTPVEYRDAVGLLRQCYDSDARPHCRPDGAAPNDPHPWQLPASSKASSALCGPLPLQTVPVLGRALPKRRFQKKQHRSPSALRKRLTAMLQVNLYRSVQV